MCRPTEEIVALVIKSIILAGLEDSEEQEATQASTPYHDEDADNDVSCIITCCAEGESQDREDNEVGAAGEVGEFVKLEAECYGKEE